jgi:hypothetical protein
MVQSFLCLKYGVHLPQLQYLLHLLGGPVLFDSDHVSPDGALRFLVRSPDGDITMGFDGYPWHTHADVLAALSSVSPEDAAKRFVADLISNKLTFAVATVSGTVRDIWITDDLTNDLRRCPPEETIEFRLWDGAKIHP